MEKLPTTVHPYKKTPVFNKDTVPPGLLKTHTTKEGTWGKICVVKGKLLYIIESDPIEKVELSSSFYGVVEPQVPHHVDLVGDVEFYVEFHK